MITSYRPLLLENIYNHGQVCILYKHVRECLSLLKVNILIREDDHDNLDIPEFEDIFAYMVCILRL